jgi:outer membrane protein assembly factor BamB
MKKIGFIACLAVLVTMAGCSWFKAPAKDNLEPPSALEPFEAKAGFTRLWSHSLGDGAGTSGLRPRPKFADGMVYVSDIEGAVYAFSADTGSLVWKNETGLSLASDVAVNEGLLVVGSLDGDLKAIDAKTGDSRWQVSLSSEILASPAIQEGVVVARSQDGRVFGLSAKDGSRQWVFDRAIPLLTLRGNSAPLIFSGNVYLGYDQGKLVALKLSDGTLQWEQALAQSDGRTELDRMVDVDGELVMQGGDLFAVSYRGQIAALTSDAGRILWSRAFSSYVGLGTKESQIYAVDDAGEVWSFDARSGTSTWKQDDLAHRWLTTPVVAGDFIVIGDFEGYMHALSADDGSLAARERVGKAALVGAPLVIENNLYVLTADGSLVAYRLE